MSKDFKVGATIYCTRADVSVCKVLNPGDYLYCDNVHELRDVLKKEFNDYEDITVHYLDPDEIMFEGYQTEEFIKEWERLKSENGEL